MAEKVTRAVTSRVNLPLSLRNVVTISYLAKSGHVKSDYQLKCLLL